MRLPCALALLLATLAGASSELDDSLPLVQIQHELHDVNLHRDDDRVSTTKGRPFLHVLVFWPVGAKKETRELVKANVHKLKSFEKEDARVEFDIFLAHYDSQRKVWEESMPSWFLESIKWWKEEKGIKFFLAKEMLVSSAVNFRKYQWVWFLDEDADLTRMNLGAFLGEAENSEAPIVSPAITFLMDLHEDVNGAVQLSRQSENTEVDSDSDCVRRDPRCRFQNPKTCRFRYVSFIELSFPMIRPEAWEKMVQTDHVVNEASGWGLDHLWCGLMPRLLGTASKTTSCAIIDAAPIVHRDFRTLDKWHHPGVVPMYKTVYNQVRAHFPSEFSEKPTTHRCVT